MKKIIILIFMIFMPLVNLAAIDNFDKIIMNWQEILIGDKYFDNSEQMINLQKKQDVNVEKLWNSLNKNADRKYLWDFGVNNENSSNITKSYRNVQALSIAVMNSKSKFYKNEALLKDIYSSLDWLKENKYSSKIEARGNWWDYEIGTPRAINDIFSMLYPIINKEYMRDYLKVITHFVPDADKMRGSVNPKLVMRALAANQTDISKVKIIQSALLKDEKGLIYARDCLDKIFPFVEKGDGFYKDGSFIQHDSVAYTAAYGNVLIDGLSQIMTLLENTDYKLDSKNSETINFWIKESFAPIMYKGLTMDMVKGRSVSREKSYVSSIEIIRSIIRLAQVQNNMEYKMLAKSLIKSNTYFDYVKELNNYRDIYLAKKILEDKNIKPYDFTENILKFYENMDRVVYKNKFHNFAFAISMSSNKTKYYEAMNGENVKGWHTGDGMTYLYNGDIRQFNDDYWATVDPYRLPGTTVELSERKDGQGSVEAKKSIVSGKVINNRKANIKMHHNNFLDTLSLDKKWLIDNDKITFKGENIKFKSDKIVQTVIENRKLNDDTNYEIYINGKLVNLELNKKYIFNNVKEILFKVNKPNEGIKYVFKNPETLNIVLENRSGSWKSINKSQSDKMIQRKYFVVTKTHTKQNDSYEYTIYPQK